MTRAEIEFRRAAFTSTGGWLLSCHFGGNAWSARAASERAFYGARSSFVAAGASESDVTDVGMEMHDAAMADPEFAMASAWTLWRAER